MCNNNIPNIMFPNMMMPGMYPNMYPNNYTDIDINSHNNNELTTRLNTIDRQLRRLEQRITKLENNNNNEYDNSMYMM